MVRAAAVIFLGLSETSWAVLACRCQLSGLGCSESRDSAAANGFLFVQADQLGREQRV